MLHNNILGIKIMRFDGLRAFLSGTLGKKRDAVSKDAPRLPRLRELFEAI